MIQLPVIPITVDEQQSLATLAATVTPARELLPLQPTNPHLWRAITIGLVAEQILWTANLRLVMRIAVDVASRRGEGLDDLFQEGCLALQEAIRRFNPALGFRLSTFAHEHITRRILRTDTSSVWVSTSTHFRRMRRLIEAGDDSHSPRQATMALAQLVDIDWLENVAHDDDPFARVDEACVDMLEFASPKYREVLRLRFGFDGRVHQQEELARHFGVSRPTISRWERKGLQQIHDALTSETTVGVPIQDTPTVESSSRASARSPRQHRHRSSTGLPSPSRTPHRLAS
ncbi:MAG: sigma-70 family RNA polymerase sigma factor [Propionibacterium sp.]|nr:sigma-70 family RNA polymerase sigma factor [Propionibacterium sp.]